ncbi:MAG: hypothetical protein MUO76_17500 [Anaerolineaceae bacterium]|nr:hypothetical protein [Anaerolineaceae bacterium]
MNSGFVSVSRIISLSLFLLLTACGLRPYDYVAPVLETYSAQGEHSATPTVFNELIPAFTPVPVISETPPVPSREFTATAAVPNSTPTIRTFSADEMQDGTAQVLLKNRTDTDIYVSLSGPSEIAYAIAPAESFSVEIPAGSYDYWIVIPKRETIHGVKIFPSGFSTWQCYKTPSVLDSPTPRWLTPTQ